MKLFVNILKILEQYKEEIFFGRKMVAKGKFAILDAGSRLNDCLHLTVGSFAALSHATANRGHSFAVRNIVD